MTNDSIRISAEHLLKHVRIGAGVVSCAQDKGHANAIRKIHDRLLLSPPNTPTTIVFGQDEECKACPINPASPKYNPNLIRRKRMEPCNPGSSEDTEHDKDKLHELEKLYGKSYNDFTTDDFQKHVRR